MIVGDVCMRNYKTKSETSSQSSLNSRVSRAKLPIFRESEGTFEILIEGVTISDDCLEYLSLEFDDDVAVTVQWSFMNFDKSNFLPVRLANLTNNNFRYEVIYKVSVNSSLVEYILRDKIGFELVAISKFQEVVIAVGQVSVSDILEEGNRFGQNYAVVLNSCIRSSDDDNGTDVDVLFSQVDISCVLKCDFDKLRQVIRDSRNSCSDSSIDLNEDLAKLIDKPTEKELKSFKEALNLVLIRNKALKTPQSEITMELKDRARWLHIESNWRRTLQEYAILTEQDPKLVPWRQWRDKNTSHVKLRTYSCSKSILKNSEFTINIVRLKINSNSSIMLDESITKLYIEYTFLNYEGPEMESPYSLRKEEFITYEFKKVFPLSVTTHKAECDTLVHMIKNREKIKFAIISEPEYNPKKPIQTCTEVGLCEVDLFNLIQSLDDRKIDSYEVKNFKNYSEIIGHLMIQFEGVLFLRRLILELMAPDKFKFV